MIKDIIKSIFPISSSSISEIESIIEYQNVEKGQTFIKRNKRNTSEYFLLDGVCRSYLINHEGEEVTITFYTSNSILSPNITRTKEEASILNFQALTSLKIAYMDAHKFEQLMIDNLEIRRFGNTVVRIELLKKIDKEIGLASLSAKERLLNFREQYPMLENIISHTDIASYLGITNISLSRIRGELAR